MPYQTSAHLHYKVLHLTGEVDLDTSPAIRTLILGYLQDGHSVLADFSGLDYIDSSGIATFVEALSVARKQHQALAIVGARDLPLQVLQLTRLDKVFDLRGSLQEVVA